MINIRKEQPEDIDAIRVVNEKAFARTNEATLVDRLRAAGKATISLVAIEDGFVIGHILFSPVTIESNSDAASGKHWAAIGLAPMAVLPEFQNRGAGSLLVNAGLDECRKAGYQCVVVLGHPAYYPRFGFVPSVQYNIRSEYNVRDEVFMILELTENALGNSASIVKYQPEFNHV